VVSEADGDTPIKSGCEGPRTDCAAIDELPVAYLEMDAEGVVVYANPAAQVMHDSQLGGLAGQKVWNLVPLAEQESGRLAYEALMRAGEEPPVIRRSVYVRGEYRTYEIHRSMVRDPEGKPCGLRSVSFDVTEAVRAIEEAHQSRLWLESVLESVSDAVIVLDALGFVRYLNPAAEVLSGWKCEELKNMAIEKGLPLLSYQSADNDELSFRLALDRHSKGVAVLLDRNRNELKVEITTSPIVDKDKGYTIGVVSVLRPTKDCAY
jgi:PAS domain S-box-containing protein